MRIAVEIFRCCESIQGYETSMNCEPMLEKETYSHIVNMYRNAKLLAL